MEELRILNGLNRGVTFPFFEESMAVGSSMESDILIPDPGISPIHAKFIRNSETKEISIQVVDGSLEDEFGEDITSQTLLLGQKVNLCGVWMCVADESMAWDSSKPTPIVEEGPVVTVPEEEKKEERSRSIFPFVLLGGGALVLTLGFKAMAFANIEDWEKQVDIKIESVSQEGLVIDGNPESETAENSSKLEYIFNNMLRERELENISLDATGDSWIIGGRLTDDGQDKLRRMILRFEKQYDPGFAIDDQTSVIAKKLPFKLVGIVSGPFGHVVTDAGERVSIGGFIQGYQLEEVSDKRIVFTGLNTIEVNW